MTQRSDREVSGTRRLHGVTTLAGPEPDSAADSEGPPDGDERSDMRSYNRGENGAASGGAMAARPSEMVTLPGVARSVGVARQWVRPAGGGRQSVWVLMPLTEQKPCTPGA
jgi:hypothetical protein